MSHIILTRFNFINFTSCNKFLLRLDVRNILLLNFSSFEVFDNLLLLTLWNNHLSRSRREY